MDKRYLVFNPGYEPSLQVGRAGYTPPLMVKRFRRDLGSLMFLLGDPEDILLEEGMPAGSDGSFMPWGWAPDPVCLVGRYTLEEMKYRGSRARTGDLVKLLLEKNPNIFESITLPQVMSSGNIPKFSELPQTVGWVVKEEFSSSGRGVHYFRDAQDLRDRLKMRHGNDFFLETLFDKVEDRGYEFSRDPGGKISYVGPSEFLTSGGRYVGNRLRPIDKVESDWQKMDTFPTHSEYLEALITGLQQLDLGRYSGFLGVDTIVYRDSVGVMRLHPCIEINVRPTMGHLALALIKKCPSKNFDGHFEIIYRASGECRDILEGYQPADLRDPSLTFTSGRYYLTPILPETRFVATVRL